MASSFGANPGGVDVARPASITGGVSNSFEDGMEDDRFDTVRALEAAIPAQ